MAVATPYIARNPVITVDTFELVCHARKVSLTAEDNMVDVDTFCNPDGEAPGSTKWTAEIDALQSFGSGVTPGLWDILSPLAKTIQTFVIRPDAAAVGATNPEATFEAWVPTISFVDSDRGDSTVMTVTFSVIGAPVFTII